MNRHAIKENGRKAKGLCPRCGGVPDAGFTNCKPCRDLRHPVYKRSKEKRLSEGRCYACGRPMVPGIAVGKHCGVCREFNREATWS